MTESKLGFFGTEANRLAFTNNEERKDFLVRMWNSTVGTLDQIPESAASSIVPHIITMEHYFPGIIKLLQMPFLTEPVLEDDREVVLVISNFSNQIDSQSDVDALTDVLRMLSTNLRQNSLSGLRDKFVALFKFFDAIIALLAERRQYNTIELSTAIADICIEHSGRTALAHKFESVESVQSWIEFVFALDDSKSICAVLKFVTERLQQDRALTSGFYQAVLKCNRERPEKFIFDSTTRVPPSQERNEMSEFALAIVEIQTGNGLIHPGLFDFVGNAYKDGILSFEATLQFLEYLRRFEPTQFLDMDAFCSFLSIIAEWQMGISGEFETFPDLDIAEVEKCSNQLTLSLFGYFAQYGDAVATYMTQDQFPFLIWLLRRIVIIKSFTFPITTDDHFVDEKLPEFERVNDGIALMLKTIFRLHHSGASEKDIRRVLKLVSI